MTPRPPIVVPDVSGKTFSVANSMLSGVGFRTTITHGKDGKRWDRTLPDKDVTAVSTDPVAGSTTTEKTIKIIVSRTEAEQQAIHEAAAAAAKLAEAEKKLATRYEFKCGSYSATQPTYHSFKEVWATPAYRASGSCTVNIDAKHPSTKQALVPSEQALVDLIASHGGDVSLPTATVGKVMLMCAKVEADYADQIVARMDWRKADIQGALSICPEAPHAAVFHEVLTTVKVGAGAKVVGASMEPGTYRTKPGIQDCYWSRTTGGGGIIANDFVGFAPDGVIVTVFQGEGFQSERCGIWTKIG